MLTRAVAARAAAPLVVADMPFGSYQVSDERRGRATRCGSSRKPAPTRSSSKAPGRWLTRVRAIVDAGIPVMGHVGLTPQSATMLGGYKAQGRTAAAGAAARRRSERARGGRLLRDRARGDSGRSRGRDHRGAHDPDDRHRRRAGLRRPGARLARPARPHEGARRASSSATPTSPARCARPRRLRRRGAVGRLPGRRARLQDPPARSCARSRRSSSNGPDADV